MYLVVVMVVVGLNYKLKEKRDGEESEGEGRKLIKSSSVSFSERRGAFSTLVSASTRQGKRRVEV